MRRILFGPAAFLTGFLVYFVSNCFAQEFSGRVVSVLDGDTIEVMKEGRPERVRLEGIDCPERKQAFGTRARQFTADLVFGKEVKLKTNGRDRYGRILGEILLQDGRSLNRELVKAGFAWWFRRYSQDGSLGELEAEARAAKRGLWADPRPTPPWEFRQWRAQ